MLPLPPETCALGFRGTVPTSLVRSFPSRLGSSSSNAGFLSSAPASLVLSMNYKHYTVYFELDNINLFTICSLGACRTTPATSRVNACICVGWNFESSTVKLKRGPSRGCGAQPVQERGGGYKKTPSETTALKSQH